MEGISAPLLILVVIEKGRTAELVAEMLCVMAKGPQMISSTPQVRASVWCHEEF